MNAGSESENEDSADQSTEIYSDDNADSFSDDNLSEGLSNEDSDFEDFNSRFSNLKIEDFLISTSGEFKFS